MSGFNALASDHFSYAYEASWWCFDYSDSYNLFFKILSSEDFKMCSIGYHIDNYGYNNPLEPDESELQKCFIRLIKDNIH